MRFLSKLCLLKRGASISVLAFLCSTMAARAELPLAGIIAQGRPVIDLRARFETVTDASKTLDANANTIRARLVHPLQCSLRLPPVATSDHCQVGGLHAAAAALANL